MAPRRGGRWTTNPSRGDTLDIDHTESLSLQHNPSINPQKHRFEHGEKDKRRAVRSTARPSRTSRNHVERTSRRDIRSPDGHDHGDVTDSSGGACPNRPVRLLRDETSATVRSVIIEPGVHLHIPRPVCLEGKRDPNGDSIFPSRTSGGDWHQSSPISQSRVSGRRRE